MADSNICSEKVHAHVRENVRDFVKSLSYLNFPIGEPSLLTMNKLIEECSPIPELVEEELLKLIFHQDEFRNENLTIKYYAKKVLVHLRTCRLEKKWRSFLTLPVSKKSLLEGALLVSQWGQVGHEHNKSLSEIEDIIDNISDKVRQLVDAKNSTGEACSDMDDQLTELKTVRIRLDCIKTVLYDEMGFTEMDEDDTCNFNNVYVDKVLQTKKGHSLVLLVIYHEVAKRLGILCLPVSMQVDYEDWIIMRHRTTSENGTVDIFISPSTGIASKGVQSAVSESFPICVVPAKDVFMLLLKYLAPCGVPHNSPCASILNKENHLHFVRLACIITSETVRAIESYAGWCNHFGYQLEQAMELLKSHECLNHTHLIECIQKFSEQQAAIANREIHGRLPWTKYAAGLVMIYNGEEDFLEDYVNSGATDTDKHQHNACPPGGLCVIVSVQFNCQCCRGAHYRVLFDNGNLNSISEDHLKLHPEGAVINNPHIGIFFERFDGRRYIPNPELMTQFPEDDAFAKSLMG
ncbi:F-box only protein 21-like isoform X1 [Daphnia pulex]|uniref:F-box only protein 21-like isoform X1 n=1 Tax=Daphnia pulex TaxID=6669 RepID=UPI001EDCE0B8|nr:F-box only protein 21-like isoform X1 [Daphnia pulex]XP_046635969.1 F-box only protein 21-like isoform X1 [Daphnia pulicaria]